MDIVFFVYGLAFFALGLVVFVQPKEKSRHQLAHFIWLLAIFGLLHGMLEWMDLWRVIRGGSPALERLKVIFLFSSFLFLFEFGRRLTQSLCWKSTGTPAIHCHLLGKRIYLVVAAGSLGIFLAIPDTLLATQIMSRYFLGFGGSLLTGIGFLAYARMALSAQPELGELHGTQGYFILAAAAFLTYGVTAGLLGPPADMFPASQFNDRWFLSSFNFPVQLLRMACAVLAAVAIANILRVFHREVRGQLEEWASALDERVKQRTKELEAARQEADAANRSKSAFLAAMSHEIRTPMNGVVGMVDLLLQTPMEVDQRQMARTVRDSAYALLKIIDEILDFSKIEAGGLTIEQAPIAIADIVESVSDMLAPGAALKGVRLMSFVDPALPALAQGDVVRLRQILFNLGGNAIKFTAGKANGRVAIRADLLPRGEDDRIWVNFQVTDNGIGMSPEVMDKIFKPFTQADASTTRHYGGTGLGLAICDRLTQLMGGRIRIESEPAKGSRFTVSLPFGQAYSPLASDTYDLSGVTVLCLGDQEEAENLQKFIAPYLEYAGARVRVLPHAYAGEAITALGSSIMPGDIVFIGAGAPLAQRKHLLAGLRDLPALTGTRFVMALRWNEEKTSLDTKDTVVVKTCPMRRMDLLRAIAQAAGRASPDIDIDIGAVKMLDTGATPPSIEEAEASGELILAVEDNETNREVLRRQLNLLGYAAEIAENGRMAQSQWERRKYGLVLTDCHMPEMDGFELTRKIREKEQESSCHVPIVAVTANALRGETERCLECGMDDYLSKPVELALLKHTLDKWLPKKNKKTPPMSPRVEIITAPHTPDGPLDLNILRNMVGDDPALHRKLLQQFIEPTKRDIAAIHASLAAGNIEETVRLAHKLKSPARTIGAHQLADACAALELAGKMEDLGQAESLDRRLDELMAPIEKWIASL